MFGNLGIHVIKSPAGTYSFVGSLPRDLGNPVKPSKGDVMAGRFYENPVTGETLTTKFPVFKTREDAIKHAESRGYGVKS